MILYKDFIKEKVNNEIKIKSAEGYPCEFKKSNGRPLKDYKIYGNSVQDGTPTPENPIEIESVGDFSKNIFDMDSLNYAGGYRKDESIISTTGINVDIYLKAGTYSLTLKCDKSCTIFLRKGQVDNGYFATTKLNPNTVSNVLSFTYKEDAWMRISSFVKDAVFYDFMLVGGAYNSDTMPEYSQYNKYKIPITINDSVTINIYLDEPLRKIGDYADYVDFKRKKVIRNVKPYVLTGDKPFAKYSSKENTACYSQRILYTNWVKNNFILCTHFRRIESAVYDTVGFAHGDTSGIVYFRIPIDAEYAQSATTFQAWVKEQYNNGTPIVIYATPPDGVVEEDIELPEITTAYGYTIMTTETAISPSNIEVKYVIK